MKNDEIIKILAGFTRSILQDFKSYSTTEINLVEDDIRLVLEEWNSSFITYEITPGIYFFKDLSEVLFNILQPENPGFSNVIDIEVDDISKKN